MFGFVNKRGKLVGRVNVVFLGKKDSCIVKGRGKVPVEKEPLGHSRKRGHWRSPRTWEDTGLGLHREQGTTLLSRESLCPLSLKGSWGQVK